ncbi:MAG: PilZ domain-containing protein [Candidatus Sulfotelmatobacter sp.]
MQAELSPARSARARYRHELRTLTYVTLDQSNGGIVRNLTHDGIAVQAVVAVRPGQQLRVRFELPQRFRVEADGEVMWADSVGKCGIRFLDLPAKIARRLDEWIFADLLGNVNLLSHQAGALLSASSNGTRLVTTPQAADEAEDDGLIVSPSPVKVIELPSRPDAVATPRIADDAEPSPAESGDLDWLSQPLSRRSIAWLVNTLTVVAALLLFVLVFLSVTREVPKWPAAMAAGATVAVAVLYWGFFKLFGGSSPGARLARLAGYDPEEEEEEEPDSARFR